MTKLAKAYKMLNTCNIKSADIIPVHEEFEAGRIYATKDIIEATPPIPEIKNKEGVVLRKSSPDNRRLLLWIEQGFCVPAGSSEKVTVVATQDEKAEAKKKADDKKSEAAADKAQGKADKQAEKLSKAELKAQEKTEKAAQKEAKKEADAAEKLAKEEAKKEAAEIALDEEKAAKMFSLWDDISPDDFPKYQAHAEAAEYEFDDAPADPSPEEWLAYFVPFFGENGPPELISEEIEAD